ncbi:hypothetical protein D6851_12180 [Altericroceibacterium spongiae]|uniref:Uncharacterized protein n=1 Tax=Altericroceibacterium spongiae TaxID=2320269 RepID=A0A420EEY3_9SPHN|nr:hypothetical protein [Altericroceibacterium spongiae]RKF19224.1 hypothetical protein D6851_12180 [Altericroceibacterium spongiae]
MRNLFIAAAGAMALTAMPAAAQMQETPEPMPTTSASPTQQTATGTTRQAPRMESNPMIQRVPEPVSKTPDGYPVCGKDQTDGCIQPRAAGKNYGNRPLDYWPGEPASQTKDKPQPR